MGTGIKPEKKKVNKKNSGRLKRRAKGISLPKKKWKWAGYPGTEYIPWIWGRFGQSHEKTTGAGKIQKGVSGQGRKVGNTNAGRKTVGLGEKGGELVFQSFKKKREKSLTPQNLPKPGKTVNAGRKSNNDQGAQGMSNSREETTKPLIKNGPCSSFSKTGRGVGKGSS